MTSGQVTGRGSQPGSASRHRLSQLGLSRVTAGYQSATVARAIAWVGVGLRLAWYLERRPIWLDEAMLARFIIARPMAQLIGMPLGDGQVAPIGFLVLERLAVVAFGSGELALRLVPVVAAVLSVWLFLAVARRTVPPELVPVAMALFAANRALVAYGAEVKQYSSDVAVALALWLVWLVVRERGRVWPLVMVGAVLVWVSQPAILVLGGLWGATLVLGPARERVRMSLAAVGWGASAALAAWVSWHRVSSGDLAYLRAFWADGFPGNPARALDHLMRVPPGVVWLALALIGLWIAVRARRTPLLLGVGPVAAAYVAAVLGWYPFADRLVLFLVPIVVLLIAQVRWAVLLALPQLVVSLLPVRHEDLRTIARAVLAQNESGDAVYVYYGAVPAFSYYAGGTSVSADAGGCHRGEGDKYFLELDRYRGRRLWLVVGHSYRGEDSLLTRYLGRTRPTLATVTANDAFARLYGPDTTATGLVVRPLPSTISRGLACRTSE